MSEIDPARLDELLAGDLPRTDAERDLLHMAAALREAAPEAPDHLRERVMSIASEAPARAGLRPPRFAPSAWFGPAAAGIAAVVIGAAVILPGLTGDDTARVPAPEALIAPEAAPEPGLAAAPPAAGPAQAGGPEAAPAQAAPDQAAPAQARSTPDSSGDARLGAPILVLGAPAGDWPATALQAVAEPAQANGAVLTGATVGTAADGREDLRIEMLIPADAQEGATAAIGEALPPGAAWEPSDADRAPVDKAASGDLLRPDAAPKELAGPDPASLTVVVVRGDGP